MLAADQGERRRLARHVVEVHGTVRQRNSVRIIQAPLHDLSAAGCKLTSSEPLEAGSVILLRIDGLEPWLGNAIWSDGEFIGVKFQQPLSLYVVDHYAAKFGLDRPPAKYGARSSQGRYC